MDTNAEKFTVFPSYSVGDNTPQLYAREDLRLFLIQELDETHEPGDTATNPDSELSALFAEGDDHGDFVRFDVTRPGCPKSTLGVSAGDHAEVDDSPRRGFGRPVRYRTDQQRIEGMQHSPGPWFVWEPEYDATPPAEPVHILIARAIPGDVHQEIARVKCQSFFLEGDLVEIPSGLVKGAKAPSDALANAELIAIAPELWAFAKLAAEGLRDAYDQFDGQRDDLMSGDFVEALETFMALRDRLEPVSESAEFARQIQERW